MGFRVRLALVLALAAAAALGSGAAAHAHDHQVPHAIVHVNKQVKQPHLWSSTWERRTGPNECVAQVGDGVPDFRPKVEVDHLHAKPRIVFRKKQRPRGVRVLTADHLRNGYLARSDRRNVSLRKSHRQGRRVWIARFRVRVSERLFIDVEANWQDVEGCGGNQSASWSFRLRRSD